MYRGKRPNWIAKVYERSVGRGRLGGRYFQLYSDARRDWAKIGADDFAAGGGGCCRWAAVSGFDARRECEPGPKRARSGRKGRDPEWRARGGPAGRGSGRAAGADPEGLPAASAGSPAARAGEQRLVARGIPKSRRRVSGLPRQPE